LELGRREEMILRKLVDELKLRDAAKD